MSARKNRPPKRLPAIVPRFIKNAVTIGAIPALISCDKGQPQKRVQPVVATYVDNKPAVVAAYAPDAAVEEIAPVVAAMINEQPPPSPVARDAGVDAATVKKKPKPVVRPPTVVAALVGRPDLDGLIGPPPAVVAAMLPDQNQIGSTPPKQPAKKPKKP